MTPPPEFSAVCPNCQRPFVGQPAIGGLCLRCAGLRALNYGDITPFTPAQVDRGGTIGPYEVVEELGRGGMGRVVAACQPGLGRIVAVKTIRAGVDPELDLRFQREIRTLSALRHPNIVAIHDSGRAGDSLYFTMDLIEGGDLATRIRAAALPWREAVPLLHKVARALVYLHAQGVLHRDLKPSNILLDEAEPKLADFGLAAELQSDAGLTAITRVLGTPHYLAPEALLKGSSAYTATGDLYSFGVVLYETLTGRTPFAGASPEGLLRLLQTAEPRPIRQLVPTVPRDLETICLKCLDRDPARRYAAAAALEEDLTRFEEGRPILARPLSPAGQLLRWTRRRPELAAIWLLVCAVALGATAAAARIAREQTRTAAALAEANDANTLARERLRAARLNEARAVVLTPNPGRRAQALAALAEAARLRPGPDLRDAALAALTTVDAEPVGTWDLQVAEPAEAAFSGDGRVAAIRTRTSTTEGVDKRTIRLQARGQAEPLGVINTPAPILGDLELNTDGSLLVARLKDATLRLWSTHPVALLCTLENRPLNGEAARHDAALDFSLDPTGRRLAVARADGGVDLFDPPSAQPSASTTVAPAPHVVRFSPDGRWLALARLHDAGARTVTILDAHDLQVVGTLPLAADVARLVWAADGRQLGILSADHGLTWFAVPLCQRLQRIDQPHGEAIEALALAPDDNVLLRPEGFAMRLTDGHYGRTELTYPGLGPSMLRGIGAGDGFLTTSFTNSVTQWRVVPPLGWRVLPSPATGTLGVGIGGWAMDISPDHRWLATADGTNIVIREAEHGRFAALVEADKPEFLFATVAFAADGTHLWRCSTASGLAAYPFAPSRDTLTVALAAATAVDPAQGYVIAAVTADRRTLALLNAEAGLVRLLRVSATGARIESSRTWPAAGAYSLAFSPDGSQLLVNCSGNNPAAERLRIYRAADGTVVRELPGLARGETTWCADGRTAMTSNGPTQSLIWNTANWSVRCTLGEGLGGDTTTFTLSADGRLALIFRDNWLHVVSTDDGRRIARVELRDANGFCFGLKQIGASRFAAFQLDGRIDLLDLAAWQNALAPLGLGW